MELSRRLSAVAGLVTKGNRLADVGTDHGYIPIYLVQRGWIPSAIAMDVNEGPLMRARENIALYNATQYIQTRLSDGMQALMPHEVDTVVMAGMGGNLIKRLLSQGADVGKSVNEWVLQPQSDVGALRHYLQKHGYKIMQEDMVFEDGKFYPMMQVCWGQMTEVEEIFFQYGRHLLEQRHPVLACYLQQRMDGLWKIYDQIHMLTTREAMARTQEVKEEIAQVMTALNYYEV